LRLTAHPFLILGLGALHHILAKVPIYYLKL
jgi:hypothetical protein